MPITRAAIAMHFWQRALCITLTITGAVSVSAQGHDHDHHLHDELEELFNGKTLHAFEEAVGFTDINNQALAEYIDAQYQTFFSAVVDRVRQHDPLIVQNFDTAYAALVEHVRAQVEQDTPSKKTPPVVVPKVLNGPCVNMDFEEGTTNGWTLTRGDVNGAVPYSFVNSVGVGPGAYHTVYTNGNDPVTGIPRVSPFGGGTSVRLGNGTGTGARAARMTQSFMVDASNYLFVYDYAVVFESPANHTLNEQPYFTVRVFDQGGASIQCGEYSVIADASSASDYQQVFYGGEIVLYKDWSQVITNLVSYIGQNVTIEFTAGDCSLTGHYGYAYVDASCGTEEITASDTVICEGNTATLTAPAGVEEYIWSTGETTQSIEVDQPGTYTCTLVPFQGMGCSILLQKNITVVPGLTVTAAPDTSFLCFGAPYVTVNSTPGGGMPPYIYNWSNGQTTQSANVTSGGTYTITLTDAGGCPPVQDQVFVSEFVDPITANAGPDITVCSGIGSNIAINGTVTGVTTGVWSGGSGTYSTSTTDLSLNYSLSAAEIAAGSATLTLTTTGNGTCPPATDQVTIVVSEMTATVASVQNLSCFGGANGSAIINATGGVLPYTYSLNGGPAQASNTFNNLTAGAYTVVVTDNVGCTGSVNFNITAPTQLTFASVPQAVSCFDECDGQITVNPNGGTAPYTYSSNGGLTYNPSNVLINLCAGTIPVVVQDANGCLTNANIAITQPTALSANYTLTDPICAGACDGEIAVAGAGGTPGYQYSVDGGALQAGGNLTGLCAGNHTVLIQDANGCELTAVQVLIDPPTFGIDQVSMTASNCGFNNGSIEVAANGANGPFTYSMDGGPAQASGLFTNLIAGAYSFVATDALGCQAQVFLGVNDIEMDGIIIDQGDALCFGGSEGWIEVINQAGFDPITYELDNSGVTQTNGTFNGLMAGSHIVTIYDAGLCIFTIPFTIAQPDEIQFTTAITDVTCNAGGDGVITFATTTGGTGAYQYSIDGFNFQTGTSFTGLTAGTYFLYVMDANGCTVSGEATIGEPTPVTFDFNSTNLSCFDNNTGVIFLDGSGGEGGYQYSIDNGVTLSPSPAFFGLEAGNYPIVVQDQVGCEATGNVILTQPAPLAAAYISQPVSCFGTCDGQLTINASGGTPPYLYSSDNGQTVVTTSVIPNLCAGNYQVQVLDDNGCGILSNATINTPTQVTVAVNTTPSTCEQPNGTISGVADGGTPGYTYSIDNVNFGASSNFTGLLAGMYTIYVLDNNDCPAQVSGIVDNETAPVITQIDATDVTCNAACDGSITMQVTGGTGTIQYSIGGAYQATGDFIDLCAGDYDLSVIDDNGCVTYGPNTITISEPPVLQIAPDVTHLVCNSISTGSITFNASGGVAPYSYSLDNGGSFGAGASNGSLPAGTYDLFVQDDNLCTVAQQVIITEPTQVVIADIATTDILCYGQCTGVAQATGQGGTIAGDYTYFWDTLNILPNSSTATGICEGTYQLSMVDDNGCWDTLSFTINSAAPFVIDTVTYEDPLCNGSCDGVISIFSPNATAYSFDGGNTYVPQSSLSTFCAGTYTVIAQNADACTDTLINVILTDPSLLTVQAGQDSLVCTGETALAHAQASGGTPPYQYAWDNGSNLQAHDVLIVSDSTLTVVAEDANGCISVSDQTLFSLHPDLTASVSGDAVSCPGDPLVLSATALTGVPAYSYTWSVGGTVVGTSSNLSIAPTQTTTYIVETSDQCTTISDTVVITNYSVPAPSVGVLATEGCAPMEVTFFLNIDPALLGGACSWMLSDGTVINACDTITATFDTPGCYDITYSGETADGCTFGAYGEDAFCVIPYPVAGFNHIPINPTYLEPEVDFVNHSSNADTYFWTFSNGYGTSSEEHPTVSFEGTDPGTQLEACLVASNYLGCADTVCREFILHDNFALYVPNTFTPDGDTYNAIFLPIFPSGYPVNDYELLIFNRWGELIFESHDPRVGWNGFYGGQLMQIGTYTWKISVQDGNTNRTHELVGHVNLLK